MKKLTIGVFVTVLSAFAQGPPRPGFGGPGPMGPGGGPPGRTVSGAPYSGTEVVTVQQVLAGGNVIQNQTKSNVFRDTQDVYKRQGVQISGFALSAKSLAFEV